jgi:hypothetical protein
VLIHTGAQARKHGTSHSKRLVKGRFIQDNFRCVQATTRLLHVRRTPSVLVKIDLARAFDSIAWPFLLATLRHLCFSDVWLNWISALLSSSASM